MNLAGVDIFSRLCELENVRKLKLLFKLQVHGEEEILEAIKEYSDDNMSEKQLNELRSRFAVICQNYVP